MNPDNNPQQPAKFAYQFAITDEDSLDRRVAAAAREVSDRRAWVKRAEDKLAQRREELATAEASLAAIDPIQRTQRLLTAAHDAPLTTPKYFDNIDLDADPRPADAQAADFFNRPGDYHQVRIEVPGATNADAVIKFTPDQQPLIVETLRQLRGALFARITITRLDIASNEVEKVDTPQVSDGPAYNIATDFNLGEKYVVCPVNGSDCDCDRTPDGCRAYDEARAFSAREAERRLISHQYGVPSDWVQPVPSQTGDTAWTITPPERPAPGRHRAPDHAIIELSADPTRYVEAIHDATYGHDDD